MASLLLDRTLWDLCLDANGDIALADDPYATAQDVACAVKVFQGELWYDTSRGIPYFGKILGKRPPLSFYKAQVEQIALTVANVASAKCVFISFVDRKLTGQIQITDTAGNTSNVGF